MAFDPAYRQKIMNNALSILRNFMVEEKIDFLLVNSTNEFLVEYISLAENSRYHLTGFTGSTGDALVTMNDVFLFVDGRYHIQADQEVDHKITTVVKLQTGQSFLEEMLNKIPKNSTLGVFARKNSQATIEKIQSHVKTKLLPIDPLDLFENIASQEMISLSDNFTGKPSEDKINEIALKDDEALLLTNLEEVSYLFNMRNFSTQFSSVIKAKAVILQDEAHLFLDQNEFENYIKTLDKKILTDKSTINGYDYSLVEDRIVSTQTNQVKLMKSVKTDAEIAHYIEAFKKTDKTVLAIRDFINKNENISEFDIAQKLEEEFFKHGAKSLSFNSIVAKDKNSALAHYSKSSKDEIIKDGSLVLIDCGAYFEGGLATDITRVFVKGEPNKLQKQVYTTVLKAFLHAYNTKIDENTSGFDIDNSTREFFNANQIEGFVFNHGLGHGIGINVHEAPPNLGKSEIAKAPLMDNMCFTIEPGLYNEEYFGVRLENSCYLKNGKVHSFVHVPYEDKLIDYNMFSEQEKNWLNEFGVI
ncbi:M24 family metallopeptidase [bacterium]|nr:M24 family metallopeptidase [bacterium]